MAGIPKIGGQLPAQATNRTAPSPSPFGPHELNNHVDPTDPAIKLGIFNNLLKAGLKDSQLVTSVNDLANPGAEQALLKRGFKPEGGGSYLLGKMVGLYGNGQRAVYGKDGSITLMCFSEPNAQTQLFESIQRDPNGVISHSLSPLPV